MTDADEQVSVQPRLDVGPKLVHVDRRRRSGHLDDDIDEAVDVLGPHGDHHRLELPLPRARQPPYIPEIEDRQVRSIGEEKVPGMRVRVVQGVAEDHLEVDVGSAVDQRLDVPAGRLHAGAVGERGAVDHAHREDATPREVGIGRRNQDVGLVGEVRSEALQILELLREVDGIVHHLRELADQQRRPQLRELGILRFQIRGDRLHEVEVSEHRALDAVMEHLDRHGRPVRECRVVHLGDRSRRERLGVELTVELVHACAQLPFHQGDGDAGRVSSAPSPAASRALRRRPHRRRRAAG